MGKPKKLYKIGHLTELLGVTPRTIRYYDQFGLLPHVKRSEGRVRLFDEEDLEIIRKIRRMQKEEYLPLDVIKARLFGEGASSAIEDAVVVTDSTASLPKELVERLNIHVMPLHLKVGKTTYQDGKDITTRELWERCEKRKEKPQIFVPSEDDFVEKYTRLAKQGYKEIYSFHLSSKFSDTYENALKASYKVASQVAIHVIDSKSAGAGLGLIAEMVATAIQNENSAEKLQVLISKNLPLVHDIVAASSMGFVFSDFDNIPDSGSGKGLIQSEVKNVKPVLSLNRANGELKLIDCCKNEDETIACMVKEFESEVSQRGGYLKQVLVVYGHHFAEATRLANEIKDRFPNVALSITEESSILSTYLGPHSLGLSFV
ncbi:MAG: DegV family EDD domain-containing protein [bacterium]|nr:DegV family EDD domain-containing protein [bacterium]